MKAVRFQELADKFDTFYLSYVRNEGGRKSRAFMVATHNLDTPYIQAKLERASTFVKDALKDTESSNVVVFSYTNDAFKVVPYQAVTRLSCLSVELDKQERSNARKRRLPGS